ncbi:MAG: hypothetical protein B1H11_09505 [Desulfobacteraceae bacterium 4484_190.1]|nr:MAG: hypothetical protein B1H11_09505 [Desulfobacteraceae bacterium 4484_190.1]
MPPFDSLQWAEVLNTAWLHGIGPILYQELKRVEGNRLIPQKAFAELAETYYATAARNMYLFAQLQKVVEALGEQGIDVILLKGAALASMVYHDAGLRPMYDIDLLAKKDELNVVEAVLLKLGYESRDDKKDGWYRKNHYHIPYDHPSQPIPIEIHWDIVQEKPPSGIHVLESREIKGFWKRAEEIKMGGLKAKIPCPEDMLLHLCLHFLKHRFPGKEYGFHGMGGLLQIYDISRMLAEYGGRMDWDGFLSQADLWGMQRLVATVLCVVNELIGQKKKIECQEWYDIFSEKNDRALASLIQEKMLVRDNKQPGLVRLLARVFEEHTRCKGIVAILRRIFPQPEILSKRLPGTASRRRLLLEYLNRPFRLFFKYKDVLFHPQKFFKDISREQEMKKEERGVFDQFLESGK